MRALSQGLAVASVPQAPKDSLYQVTIHTQKPSIFCGEFEDVNIQKTVK
ncbi:MAG: hypothetical protein LBH32_02410 [Dysgonamonadaceae bacterium]|nr:hypothetical protein [Dysgonamonadaceae bacterium]